MKIYRSVKCTYAGTERLRTRKEKTEKRREGANAKPEKMWRRWIYGISSCDLTVGRVLIDAHNSSQVLNYES